MHGFAAGALQSLDRLILRQVKRQQLCIGRTEVSTREVDSLLLRLDAAEGDELRQLSSSSHEGASTVTEVVVEDAVRRRRRSLKAADAKPSKGAQSPCKVQALGRVAASLQRRDLGLVEHSRDHLAALWTKLVARETVQEWTGMQVRDVKGY